MTTAPPLAGLHQSAENLFAEAAGVRYAYRRFGRRAGAPLVLLQHFRGNLDSWDPALTDALAAQRIVQDALLSCMAADR